MVDALKRHVLFVDDDRGDFVVFHVRLLADVHNVTVMNPRTYHAVTPADQCEVAMDVVRHIDQARLSGVASGAFWKERRMERADARLSGAAAQRSDRL